MAIASRWLSANYDRPGFDLFRYNVYAVCSDGDMMEGISGEAASLARASRGCRNASGPNSTTTTASPSRGKTSLAFSEDVGSPFRGLRLAGGVIHCRGDNQRSRRPARGPWEQFRQERWTVLPTLGLSVRSHIAYVGPNAQRRRPKPDRALGARGYTGLIEVRLTVWPA